MEKTHTNKTRESWMHPSEHCASECIVELSRATAVLVFQYQITNINDRDNAEIKSPAKVVSGEARKTRDTIAPETAASDNSIRRMPMARVENRSLSVATRAF
jgi:hypothetical protein